MVKEAITAALVEQMHSLWAKEALSLVVSCNFGRLVVVESATISNHFFEKHRPNCPYK